MKVTQPRPTLNAAGSDTERANEAASRSDALARMDVADFELFVLHAFRAHAAAIRAPGASVSTYRDVGIVTKSRGLVMRIGESTFLINLLRR